MKKTLLASSIIATCTLNTHFVIADDVVETDEHILVTANRSQQDSFLALSANQIITREAIEQLQVTSVSDILKTVAGMHVANQGGAGQASSVYTRGTNSNHTLILIDGVRVGSATLGTVNLSAISAQQIERIEIVKGPRAALWGSDAIGGVIQIFTKQHNNGEGIVSIGAGSNGLFQAAASIGFGYQKHQYTLNVSTEKADGFNAYVSDPNNPYDINEPDEDGYDRQSVSLKGNSQLTETISMNLVTRFEESNSDYDASYPDSPCWDDYTKVCPSYYANKQTAENYHLRLAGVYQTDKLSLEASIAQSQDQGSTYGNGIDKGDADEIKTERDQFSLVGNYQLTDETGFSFGTDWYEESVSTNTDKDNWTPGFQSWALDKRTVSAIFAQARHQANQFIFEVAGRYDDIEKLGNESNYNVSIGYQLPENWLVSLNSGTAFKAPTFNDLYWPGSGNPDLRPESSKTHEILVRKSAKNSLIEISLYDTEVEDLIAWSPNEFGQWQPANINQAEMQGIDVNFSGNYYDFDYLISLTYVETEDKSTGEELLRRPKFSASYVLNYHWQDWLFGTVISYRDEAKDSGNVDLDDYWLVDLTTSYQVNDAFTVAGKVSNAFNKNYQSALNYQADDTNYSVNLSYTF
ncbi:MAG: TonB-dependent receptor [Thalassotalea sp.]|nr:TonB-dependent receptor [Thalassotalea sp.]